MLYGITTALNLSMFLLPILIAVSQYQSLDRALKIFVVCISFDFLTECVAAYKAYQPGGNLVVYAVAGIIATMLVCVYFNYSIRLFYRYHIGYALAGLSAVLGLLGADVKSLNSVNDSFYLYQGMLIICLALLQLVQCLKDSKSQRLNMQSHFWIASLLICFWVISFLYWGLDDFIADRLINNRWLFNNLMILVCCTVNICLSIIFYRNAKRTRVSWIITP